MQTIIVLIYDAIHCDDQTMPNDPEYFVAREHLSLCQAYGEVQERCSRVMAWQQSEIERLRAQVVRLRAEMVVRETALAYAREDHDRLVVRLAMEHDPQAIAADLVLCQTGCLGHGNFWREQDQCRRTGRPCALLEAASRSEISEAV